MVKKIRMSFLILSFVSVNIFLAPPIIYNALANDQDMLSTSKESYFDLAQKNDLRIRELLTPTLLATSVSLTNDLSRNKLPSISLFTSTVEFSVNPVKSESPNGIFTNIDIVNADSLENISSATSGDDFLFYICVNNISYNDQSATMSWIVRNSRGIYSPFTHEYVPVTLPARQHLCWKTGRLEFPYNTVGGDWSFQGILHPSSTTSGGSQVKTVYVNSVSQATPEPTQPPVFVRNVYLANNRSGQGSMSSVQAGSAFHPVIYWTNRASRKIPVSWTISISYNGQTILEEKGTRDADPGDRSWRMETFSKPDMVISSGATPGRYLLRGTICKLPVVIDLADCAAEELVFSVTAAPLAPTPAPTAAPTPRSTDQVRPSVSEVIVFVHGWQGTGEQKTVRTAREQFGFVADELERAGYPIRFALLRSSTTDGTPSIFSDTNYNILKETISNAKRESGKSKVILIAHSMGGLIARRYVNSNNSEYAGDVSKLFTFGTPHEGLDPSTYNNAIARYWILPLDQYCNPGAAFRYQPPRDAACDFVYNIGEFNRLYPLRNDVSHYFVSGNSSTSDRTGSYDLVTPLYSGRAAHLDAASINRLTTNESHITSALSKGYFLSDGQSYNLCIRPILINHSAGCNGGDDGTLPAGSDENNLFIRRQYIDFLGRVADDEGLAFWSDHLTRLGWNRARVVQSIYSSDEVQNRGIAVIVRFYYAALYRRPDYDGLIAHTSSLYAEGKDTDNLYRRLGNIGMNFINSPEFQGRYGNLDNKEFLVRIYRNVLNREPDEIGLQDWLRYLDSGHTRGEFLRDFVLAAEVKSRYGNETLVSTAYAAMLKCQASDSNYITWIKNLRSGWTAEAFINEILKDKNYQNRTPCLG